MAQESIFNAVFWIILIVLIILIGIYFIVTGLKINLGGIFGVV
ncbi:MAG: hypothetical protein QXF15_01630 [Candidatus Aenigmatarchaeota archaeon]